MWRRTVAHARHAPRLFAGAAKISDRVHAAAGAGKGDGEGVSMKAHKQQLSLVHGKDMRARSAKRAGLSVEIPEVAMESHMDTKACKVRRLPSRHLQLRPRIRLLYALCHAARRERWPPAPPPLYRARARARVRSVGRTRATGCNLALRCGLRGCSLRNAEWASRLWLGAER